MHAIPVSAIDLVSQFEGFSANFSGSGFTDMRFKFHGLTAEDFDKWVAKVRAAGGDLDLAAYNELRQSSRDEPVHYYARFDADLYHRVLNLCVEPGQVCKSQLMAADAHGGEAMQDMHGHDSHGMAMPADAPKPLPAPAGAAH